VQILNDPWPWEGTLRGRPLTLRDLIVRDTVSPLQAATLAWTIGHGASVFVCAGPPGAGKSTIANALLEYLPDDARVYVTSGALERFNLPQGSDGPLYLLINELSGHMPVYLSGAAARQALQLTSEGVRVFGTLHARNSAEAVRVMCYEARLAEPPRDAPFVFAIVQAGWVGRQIERRVVEVGFLSSDGELHDLLGESGAEVLAAWTRVAPDTVRAQIASSTTRFEATTLHG
jgi:type IV secretory pathway ATPase VirB11/archaellum biosynthesis ATPase